MRLSKITILLFFLLHLHTAKAQESHDFEISKNLDIYTSLIQQLNLHYVDEIQPGALTKASIDAMLKQIDPYTVFYAESEIEDVRFLQTGKYGGVGSSLHIKDGNVVVGMPYPNFPFYKAGLRAGDVILEIDGEKVSGKSMNEVSDRLRGAAGTTLNLTYRSVKNGSQQEVDITREQIIVKDVPYFGKLEDGIGYIKLSGFKQNAAEEVKQAIDSLSKTTDLHSIVFDLRDNGGGLLIQAVNIMDMFVGANELIVSTKGKTLQENHTYKTRMKALYPDLKVAVLINNRSASASEIVAGSFQDLDRGVIMGQKSFGKGLVQKVFPLSYRAQAKITVSKYYIPSGRCIQSLDYQNKDKYGKATRTADSLMATFKTRNGRFVKDAGGIIPDIPLEREAKPELIIALEKQYEVFDFATHYVNIHDSITSISDFEADEELYNSFLDFVKKDSFVYTSSVDLYIEKLTKEAKENAYELDAELKLLQDKIIAAKQQEYELQKAQIKSMLLQEIVSRYYYKSGMIQVKLRDDEEVKNAIELLRDQERYISILSVDK